MAVVTIYSQGELEYVVLPSREVLSKHPDDIAVSINNAEQSSFWLNETRKRTIQEEGTQFFKQHADKLDTSLSMEDADGKMSDGFFLYLAFRRFQNQQNQSYFINDDDVDNLLKPDPNTKNNLSKSFASDSLIRIGNLDIPVELATDPVAGLSGRDNLIPGTGMLFHLDGHPVITMQGMKFPLDLVWMAGGRVVDLTENALVPVLDQETLYIPEAHATDVLEINGGEVQRLGIKIGDFVVGDNLLWTQSNLSKLLVLETALEHLLKMKPGEAPEYGDAPPNTPAYKGKRGGSFYYPSEVGTFTSVDDAAEEDIPIGEEVEREVVQAKEAGGMVPWRSYAEMLPTITKEEVSKQLKDAKREGWPGVRDKTPVTPGTVMRDDDGNITSLSTPDGHMISVKEVDPKEPDRGGKSGLVIARTADAEVQAQWVDSQGRKQATYSFEHTKEAEGHKAAEVADLVEVLPALEKALKRDVKNPKPLGKMRLTTIREAAFTVALIHDTFRRIGGSAGATLVTMDGKNGKPKKMDKDGKPVKEYVKTYGITTILGKHAKVAGNKVTLDFLGKKGVRNVVTVSDSSLARELIRRKKEGGPNRTLLNITPSTVNAYLKRVSGRDLTAKNFRTYHGTRLGLEALDAVGKVPSIKQSTFEVDMVKLVSTIQKKGGKDLTADEWSDAIELYVIDAHNRFKVNLIGEPVSKRLGNEPSMALNSYISDAIFEKDWDPGFSTEMEKLMNIPRFSARKVASIQVKIKEQAAAARIKKKEAAAKLAQ